MWRFVFIFVLLFGFRVHADFVKPAATISQYFSLPSGRKIYTEYRPARDGRPPLVFLNGRDYTTNSWSELVSKLDRRDPNVGILLFDLDGQGKTLSRDYRRMSEIPFLDQRDLLKSVIDGYEIKGDKFLFGLSYGGGVALSALAKYPDEFVAVGAMAPFTKPIPALDKALRSAVGKVSSSFFSEAIYDLLVHQSLYLQGFADLELLIAPFKLEGLYNMIRGSKTWDASELVSQFPERKLNLIASRDDRLVTLDLMREFWASVPEKARGSYLEMKGGSHRMDKSASDFLAGWIMEIVNKTKALRKGQVFVGDVRKMDAESGATTLDLTLPCADLLKK